MLECPRGDDPLTTTPGTCGGHACTNEVQVFMIAGNQAGGVSGSPVNYKLRFFDFNGVVYTTPNIGVDTYMNYDGASGVVARTVLEAQVEAALEGLPNNATGDVSVTIWGDGTSSTYLGDTNIRFAVSFKSLSGNVPDMNVIPGTATALAAPGTPAVAQPFNRIQVFLLSSIVGPAYTISATIFPLNLTSIRKDSSLAVDDTTTTAASVVGSASASAVGAAIVAAVAGVPTVAYYGGTLVSAAAHASATGSTYVVTLVLPNANLGTNPVSLTIRQTALGADVTTTTLISTASLSTDGNTEYSLCANRGVCDYASGLCKCFTGYYGTACSMQSALAM